MANTSQANIKGQKQTASCNPTSTLHLLNTSMRCMLNVYSCHAVQLLTYAFNIHFFQWYYLIYIHFNNVACEKAW